VKDAIADIALQKVLTRSDEFDVIAIAHLNGDYLSRTRWLLRWRHRDCARATSTTDRPCGIRGDTRHRAEVRQPRQGQPRLGDPVRRDDAALHGLLEAADAIITAMDRTIGRRP